MPCKATLLPVEISRDHTPGKIWDWLLRKRKDVRDATDLDPEFHNSWGTETLEIMEYETRMADWEDEQEEARMRLGQTLNPREESSRGTAIP
ncbi:hypothetical protein Dda_8724 [Drechslerella dactyloides]|uniref:Uncharacterized protein n=1 Tax=Drechslerella dactyloides TaxID=74499 RepID=A0AAD6NFW8_DREDA|nr:hypothetical protein Dda_8724 [Drechslerella dactyloides]